MASPKGGTAIETGLITRIATGFRYALSGKSGAEFFGPGTAIPAAAQEVAHGRQFDYDTNFNITTRPRGNEPIDFPTLRALADTYDLVRLAIETRKDQMGKLKWQIVRKDTSEQDETAKTIEAFLQEPDGEHDFLDWSRMLYEDLLVIDAPAVYIRPTLGGQVFALEQIDGATISRKLDGRGRTPAAPKDGETFDPAVHTAYQQTIKGLPATNYHRDELIYRPRNPRVHKVYGYSPVEQIIVIVNLGLRREAHQLAFYTAGNIPDMIMGTPATWTPDNIAKYQKLWDMMLEGDLEARRHMKFVPGDLKPLPLRPESSLFDAFDEWLARVVCYCFNLPPNAFIKQQNRATAESAQAVALEEGLAPLMEWKERLMNTLIRKAWKTNDYVFNWLDDEAEDPLVQAQIDQIYVDGGIRLPNEIRDDHGWEQNPELDARKLAPPTPPAGPTEESKKTDEKVGAVAETAAKALVKIEAIETRLSAPAADPHPDPVVEKLLAAIGELRLAVDALQKDNPSATIPTVSQMADALAKMVESGTPLNDALKAVGFSITVPGGDVSLVPATRIPMAIASDPTSLEAPPQPIAKRAPEPAPIPPSQPIHIESPVQVDVHLGGITATVEKSGAKTMTMVKQNGDIVRAEITED